MEDPGLNRRIDETRELHTRWGQFHDFFTMALKGEQATAEAEMKFLELKTRICMLHDGFMQSLKHDHKVGQQVLGILGQCILLRRIPNLSNAEVQKLELDWNEGYMLMNETIAGLEEERQRLANINEKTYRLNKAREVLMARIHNILMNGWLQLGFFFLLIPFFLIWGVPAMGIYEWSRLKKDLPFTRKGVEYIEQNIYRKYFNAEYEYEKILDFNPKPALPAEAETQNASKLTREFFISQVVNMGFKPESHPEARAIMSNTIGYDKEKAKMKKTEKLMYAGYFLLNSTADAKKLVAKRLEDLATYPPEVQAKVNGTIAFYRKANFIAIMISDVKELREDYPKAKWGFTDEDKDKK